MAVSWCSESDIQVAQREREDEIAGTIANG